MTATVNEINAECVSSMSSIDCHTNWLYLLLVCVQLVLKHCLSYDQRNISGTVVSVTYSLVG